MRDSMILKALLLAVLVLGVAAAGLEAQTFSVDVDVETDDAELRSLSRSFFSRELRELGDVRVGEAGTPDYAVTAIVERVGRRGWMMSAVITSLFSTDGTVELAPEVEAAVADYSKVVNHSLSRGDSNEDLGRQIGLLAKQLNTEILKPRRKEMKKN